MSATHSVSPHSGQARAAAIGGAGDSFPGGHSGREPPDTIPNSEVKTLSADDSMDFVHARVGHCQALKQNPRQGNLPGVFLFAITNNPRVKWDESETLKDASAGLRDVPFSSCIGGASLSPVGRITRRTNRGFFRESSKTLLAEPEFA